MSSFIFEKLHVVWETAKGSAPQDRRPRNRAVVGLLDLEAG